MMKIDFIHIYWLDIIKKSSQLMADKILLKLPLSLYSFLDFPLMLFRKALKEIHLKGF
jgi:hypothetical protein